MAEIGWIDFSPADRERIGTILDILKPEGVVDELGIGTIRNAFADQMFPGISTIQTRAKYFFIIPYILFEYQVLPSSKRISKSAAIYLKEREYEVMWDLAEKYDHKENCGVIGITKYRGEPIMRRPSAIYWNGLAAYGFIQTRGFGVDAYMRQRKANMESLITTQLSGDDRPADDLDAEHENYFNLHVKYDKKWQTNLSMDLTQEEADQLYHRIVEIGGEKLIGELIQNKQLFGVFNAFKEFDKFVKAVRDVNVPDKVRSVLVLAHDFSEFMYGAHIAYNCQVQTMCFGKSDYEDDWQTWINGIRAAMIDYNGFHPDKLFEYAFTTKGYTRNFVQCWWEYVSGKSHAIQRRNELILQQEDRNKRAKARLRWKKMDDVREGEWIGLKRLEYRMPQAKRILLDIKQVLKG